MAVNAVRAEASREIGLHRKSHPERTVLPLVARGWVYAIEAKWEPAERDLRAALELDPYNPLAVSLLDSIEAEKMPPLSPGQKPKDLFSAEKVKDPTIVALRKRVENGSTHAAFELN